MLLLETSALVVVLTEVCRFSYWRCLTSLHAAAESFHHLGPLSRLIQEVSKFIQISEEIVIRPTARQWLCLGIAGLVCAFYSGPG